MLARLAYHSAVEHEIRFSQAGRADRRVRVAEGSTLMEAVRQAGLPIARACGGDGLCGRCGLEILAGAPALSPPSSAEDEAKQRNRVPLAQRLACRARISGPISATASYW